MKAEQNRTGLLTVFLSLVFYVAVYVTAVYFIHANTQVAAEIMPSLQTDENVKMGALIDSEGRQKELNAVVKEGMVVFSANVTPFMINGRGKADLYIENPLKNENRFTVTIIRDSTGEETYHSGYLDPEQYIGEVTLDTELDKGKYAHTMNLDTYRIHDNSYIGGAVT